MAEATRRPTPAEWLDSASADAARDTLRRCCGSARWVEGMLSRRPFGSMSALHSAARTVWDSLGHDDYLEAFACHPAIGADLSDLRQRFTSTATWSADEQAGVSTASEAVLRELQAANRTYRERFGFVFLISATDKTADFMLAELRASLDAPLAQEIHRAAAEQVKITSLRLEKVGP